MYLDQHGNFRYGNAPLPRLRESPTGSRAFKERREDSGDVDWCAFICPEGHEWARPGWQAVK